MNLIEFSERYPDEISCQKAFKDLRDKEGIICKKCGGTSHYWKSDKMSFECKKCKFRTSLRSGTVMEHSRLPFRYWLLAIHLMTSTKKSISALEMQRQLGHKFYEPIWEMMHKIRLMMGKRDTNYVLDDTIELDEGFFTQVKESQEDADKNEQKKRGRGSQNKAKVLVMTSTEPVARHQPRQLTHPTNLIAESKTARKNLKKQMSAEII